MAVSTDEIRHRLTEFAAKWGGYSGSERAEAQTFLNELLECYGTDRQQVDARFEEPTGGKFMDMVWPGVCIVEMKRPSEADKLDAHREQALDYWKQIGTPAQPAPPWVVLCAFHRFEVWKPGDVFTKPLTVFDLAELPENLDALLFLAGREPGFFARDASPAMLWRWLPISMHRWTRERQLTTPCCMTSSSRRCGRCLPKTWACCPVISLRACSMAS